MGAAIHQEGCPRRIPAVLTQERRNRHVVRSGDGQMVHVLNETARAVWDLCDGATTPEEMVESIVELFAARRDAVAGDVERVLGELETAQLLSWTKDGKMETA